MIIVNNIKLPIEASRQAAVETALKTLKLKQADVIFADIHKISVDARKGVKFVYSVAVELKDIKREQLYNGKLENVAVKQQTPIEFGAGSKKLEKPPVVCGLGPAGLFCALALARHGFNPIVLEQGQDIDQRTKTVDNFSNGGGLNIQSNIQFGEGGAGTFSDGKLTTRIGDHRCNFVTQALIDFGAPKEIGFLAKPHIGTDLLVGIIKNIRQEIIALGGKVFFNTKLTDITVKNGSITSVVANGEKIETQVLILATGHSARDTFFMLKEKGADMTAKPFSVGVRIESLQKNIDRGLYHNLAGHPQLPKGEYQLSTKVNGRGVYTFCMCPGGTVVAAASEENTVVVNGMSRHARDGKNANSALVVSVEPADFGKDFTKAVEFQRQLEQKAFVSGGGNYKAPVQTVDRFLQNKAGANFKDVLPSYPIGVTPADFGEIFPNFVTEGLKGSLQALNNKLNGFALPQSVLTGVETRTSSPVRINRNQEYLSNIGGLYPCGEGAGYAGGIMSAAVDGVRVAQQICSVYKGKL